MFFFITLIIITIIIVIILKQQLYISSLEFVELFPLFLILFYVIVFLSNVRPKRLFSLIRALTPPPYSPSQRTVSVYILVYIVIYVQKCQKSCKL